MTQLSKNKSQKLWDQADLKRCCSHHVEDVNNIFKSIWSQYYKYTHLSKIYTVLYQFFTPPYSSVSWTDATLKGTNRNFITINVPVTFTIKSIIEFVNGQKRILTVSSQGFRENKASSLNSLQRKKINDPLIVSFHAHEDFDVWVSVTTVRAEHAGSLSWSELLFALKAADPLTVNESAEWADMEQIYTRLHFRRLEDEFSSRLQAGGGNMNRRIKNLLKHDGLDQERRFY